MYGEGAVNLRLLRWGSPSHGLVPAKRQRRSIGNLSGGLVGELWIFVGLVEFWVRVDIV